MQVLIFLPYEAVSVGPKNAFVAAWRVTGCELIQAKPGCKEAWKLQCDEFVDIPDAEPLIVYRLDHGDTEHLPDSYILLWRDQVWRTDDVNILQWLITGRNPNLMGFKGNSNLDSGYFYCPYIPKTAGIVLDPKTYMPSKGILTRYGKKLVS